MPSYPTLHGIRTGPRDSTPVVLLHSAGLDLTYWDEQIAALRPHHDVVAFDLPGHGGSRATASDITLDVLTAAVIRAVQALDAGPVHLIGLSVGGLIAQNFALTEPALLTSLTLVDTAARFGDTGRRIMHERADRVERHGMVSIVAELIDHWFEEETILTRPQLVDRAVKTLVHDDPDVQAALWRMIASFDVQQRLAEITAPTLILVGENDASSPVASSRELLGGIPAATMEVIPAAAHLSPLDHPEAFNRHVRDFLASFDGITDLTGTTP